MTVRRGVKLQVVTIIIAATALVVSCLSLGWQMFTFTRSGRRARVYVSVGWRGTGKQLILQSIKRNDDPLDILSRLSGNGPSTPVLGVTVHNVGRSDLYVSAAFITEESQSSTYLPAADKTWPPLPYLLKAGIARIGISMSLNFKNIWKTLDNDRNKEIHRLGVRVTLKDGRTIPARRQIKLEELQRIWNVSTAGNGAAN